MGPSARVAVALVALFFIFGVSSASAKISSSEIDKIINQGWETYKSHMLAMNPRAVQQAGQRSNPEPRLPEKQLTHKCLHHEHSKLANYKKIDAAIRARSDSWRADPAVSTKRSVAAFGPLRITANSLKLGANVDNGYACYSVGETVTNTRGQQYQCTANDIMNSTLVSILRDNVIPTAITILGRLLSVDQLPGNFFFDTTYISASGRSTCGDGIQIPADVRSDQGGSGIPNTDYLVFVTARPSAPGNLASALACNLQVKNPSIPKYGRPLGGYINFNPSELRGAGLSNQVRFNRYVRVAVHEFMHALGFSNNWYSHYVDDGGLYYTTGPVETATTAGNTVNVITLPRVKLFAQAHYNCSSVTGFELEDGGGSGTAGAHWELRVGYNEIMTGFANTELIISNLTLSLFRDMGWYQVNYTLAEPFILGYKQGCSFALDKCNTWTQRGTFCTQQYTQGGERCTVDRRSKGYCDFSSNVPNIPIQYQYFPGLPNSGSPVSSKDYCPTIESFSNGVCSDVDSFSSAAREDRGFVDSRCFEVSGNFAPVACLRHRCSSGFLEVLLDGNWIACNGTSVTWPGENVQVSCAKELCTVGPVSLDTYVYTPPPPSVSRLSPGAPNGAPSSSFLYYFTDDPFLFYGIIAAGIAAIILLIVIIAMCCRGKKK
eukprot:TRINITY_DN361_c0_g1_i2.p1 TRINITY_DN361_c0_g1~~TRINITY_DN361_c0_g1_i2.p1  ORF type:complete len:661 (-),score=104.63 TRINITY_DN361_c0_g1_i2:80-2062(-)